MTKLFHTRILSKIRVRPYFGVCVFESGSNTEAQKSIPFPDLKNISREAQAHKLYEYVNSADACSSIPKELESAINPLIEKFHQGELTQESLTKEIKEMEVKIYATSREEARKNKPPEEKKPEVPKFD